MSRPKLLIALLPAGALVAMLGACSSTVAGTGAAKATATAPSASSSSAASTPATGPLTSDPSPAPSITPVTATVTATSRPKTSSPSTSHPPTTSASAVVGLPSQESFTYSVDCTDMTGLATATLKWTSTKNTAEVWVAQSLVAFGGGDERNDPAAKGPLSPNGSLKIVFNCAEQYNYYHMTSYNVNGNSTITEQVVRNI